jgi:hypothetical protein
MAGPLLVLYGISIGVAYTFAVPRAAAEPAGEPPDTDTDE